jgi:hypothetical protein
MKTYQGYDGDVELHEDHLVLRREGLMAKSSGRGGTREIPIAALSGVDFKAASRMFNGHLQLLIAGADAVSRNERMKGDPNTVNFRYKHSSEFEELAELLRDRIATNVEAGIDPSTIAVDRGTSRFERIATGGSGTPIDPETGEPDLVAGLHKKAQSALADNLAEDEPVRVVVNGAGNSAMIGTDRRVFIFKTGLNTGATFGSKFSSYDYRNIGGVGLHFSLMTGAAVLDVAGAAPVGSSYWGNDNNDPWKAANAIPVVKGTNTEAAVATLRELIADWHNRSAQPGPAGTSTGTDVPTQIKQLGELRDQGLITPEEFEAKKTDLLSRL